MTLIAFIFSVVLGCGSLAYGYSQSGITEPVRGFVWLGVLWLLAHWKRLDWVSSIAFLITICSALYGVWNGLASIWMLLGALGGLLGWDLSDFARRLRFVTRTDDIPDMERRHLARVGVVAALGIGISFLSLVIHVKRLAFEVAVGLILLAALGLTRLVIGLRRF
ncbi:MAG: hypothetical protein IT313_08130 [Anaerolineales bacterium]|nr:hypothetical protein [Anaerolineales bacterium]